MTLAASAYFPIHRPNGPRVSRVPAARPAFGGGA
ncbi:hypothetical protein SAMN05421681_108124 [Lysobacter enzymogenes]|nr:hypothetical protein SAMN05421681_108124 [Lysobacter enzymogenes]